MGNWRHYGSRLLDEIKVTALNKKVTIERSEYDVTPTKKETYYAIHYRSYSYRVVAPGGSLFLHHGWLHSHPPGDRDCRCFAESHSRRKCAREEKLISNFGRTGTLSERFFIVCSETSSRMLKNRFAAPSDKLRTRLTRFLMAGGDGSVLTKPERFLFSKAST